MKRNWLLRQKLLLKMNAPEPETLSYVRLILASVTLIGLLAAFAFALKYVVARGWVMGGKPNGKRLRLIESLALDARRRLVLVRCDGRDHLLLLGATQDLVVTSGLDAPVDLPSPEPVVKT